MSVTIETKSRSDIRTVLSVLHGSVSKYCVKRRFEYPIVTNLLNNKVSPSRYPDIVSKINEDTGADMAAWER